MRLHRRILARLTGLALLGAAFTLPAMAQSADEQALAQAVDALNRAMVAADGTQLNALTLPGLSYGHSAGRIETREQFVSNLTSRNNPFAFINTTNQTISIQGNNAIVRHILTGETTGGGKVTPVHIGIMQVWVREGSGWKLLARQAYRI